MTRITRSQKIDPNGDTIHYLQEHIKYLNRQIRRCSKESHINLLNQEIQRTQNLKEKLRLKEITIEKANQELDKLREEVKLLKEIIDQKNETINNLREENEALRSTNEETQATNIQLVAQIEHFRDRNNSLRQELHSNCNNFILSQQKHIEDLQRTIRVKEESDHEFCNQRINRLENRISYFDDRERQRAQGIELPPYFARSDAFLGEQEFDQQFNH
ncbi:13829_t:CDS:1 [Cetraspora pellucida]|uniref:13829_t:CDS:1 n=1 Tax=Cetraspora pellucida TaxID=1433469 RepID=A0A9N9NBT0_9GLOM|nr:13829_t:CDS:1 [Cetraspora pellucida]